MAAVNTQRQLKKKVFRGLHWHFGKMLFVDDIIKDDVTIVIQSFE